MGIALVTTTGATAVPATVPGLVGLVFALATVVWAGDDNAPRWAPALACVALGVAASQVWLRAAFPLGHDGTLHLAAMWTTAQCWLAGDLWPRWNPWLGLGIPILSRYPPLPWQLGAGLMLGVGVVPAWRLLWVGTAIATAASTWVVARRLGETPAGAAVAATAVCLAPYRLLDSAYRGAIAEGLGFVLVPGLAWGALRPHDRTARWTAAISAAGLVLVHPITLVAAGLLLAPIVVVRRGWSLLLVLAAAAGVTAWWWLPWLAERHHTAVGIVTTSSLMELTAVDLFEPVYRRGWPDLADRISGDRMPLYAGVALLGLALVGRRWERAGPGSLGILLGCAPFATLLVWLQLSVFQFPWRVWAPASVLLALAAAGAVRDRRTAAAAVALLAVDAVPLLGAGGLAKPWTGPPGGIVTEDHRRVPLTLDVAPIRLARKPFHEHWTRDLRRAYGRRKTPEPDVSRAHGATHRRVDGRLIALRQPPPAWSDGEPAEVPLNRQPGRIAVTAPPAGRLVVPDAWFPGWTVRLDDGPPMVADHEAGRLAVEVPAGVREVVFVFGWTWPHRLGVGIGISTVFLVGGVTLRRRRRGAPRAADPAADRSVPPPADPAAPPS